MPSFPSIAAFFVISLGSLAFSWYLPVAQGVSYVQRWGYWLMLALFVLLLSAIIRYARAEGIQLLERAGRRNVIFLIMAALFASLLVSGTVERGFKVQMDESVLASTTQSMHLNRDVSCPLRVYEIRGVQEPLDSWLDKRPLMLPFLGSLWADLFGFRPHVLVELNTLLSFLVCVNVALLGWLLARWPGAVLALLLLTSYPLMVIHFNSGNMSVINMLGFTGLLLASTLHLRKPGERTQELVVYAALFLAWCRYESVLYCGAAGAVILWAWWKQQDRTVSWALLLAPLFLVPWVWQQRMFLARPQNWELEGVATGAGGGSAFSLDYLAHNIGEWVYVALNWDREIPNSPLIGIVGILALLFLLLSWRRIWRRESSPLETGLFLFMPFVAFHLLVLLLYVWNPLVDIIWRLYLPIFFYLGLLVVWLVSRLSNPRYVWLCVGGLLVYQLGYTWPLLHSREYEVNAIGVKEFRLTEHFLRTTELDSNRTLFISDCVPFFAIHRYSAIGTGRANAFSARVDQYLQSPERPEIYYMQSMVLNPATKAWEHNPRTQTLSDVFSKEEVVRYPYSESRAVFFWRITGLVEGADVVEMETLMRPPENLLEYRNQWIFMLP